MVITNQPFFQVKIQGEGMVCSFFAVQFHQHGRPRLHRAAFHALRRCPYLLRIQVQHHFHGRAVRPCLLISQ